MTRPSARNGPAEWNIAKPGCGLADTEASRIAADWDVEYHLRRLCRRTSTRTNGFQMAEVHRLPARVCAIMPWSTIRPPDSGNGCGNRAGRRAVHPPRVSRLGGPTGSAWDDKVIAPGVCARQLTRGTAGRTEWQVLFRRDRTGFSNPLHDEWHSGKRSNPASDLCSAKTLPEHRVITPS